MFTDIVGYTALMGEDEHKAFELLHKNRAIQLDGPESLKNDIRFKDLLKRIGFPT